MNKQTNKTSERREKLMNERSLDGQESGFQDGGCFARSLKRQRINNHGLTTILNPILNLMQS